jgi:hypothetical protein
MKCDTHGAVDRKKICKKNKKVLDREQCVCYNTDRKREEHNLQEQEKKDKKNS